MRLRRVVLAAVLLGGLLVLGVPSSLGASGTVSITVFHEHLAPYGRWVVAGSVGNVWVPRAAAGWAPYVDGQWVYTDYGWTWVSDDPWGDIPCHYGAWAWVDPYGWVWAPGTVWAPAWVTWAYTDDFIGWAPIPPTFALSFTGYVGAPIVVAQTRYVFVPAHQFVGVRVATVRVPVQNNAVIFPGAVKTTNFQVSGGVVRTAGPPPSRIERITARKLEAVSIDRVKTRPTTLAEAGVTKASAVRVALPASERERLAGKPEAKSRPEAQTKPAPKAKPEAHAAGEQSRPEAGTSGKREHPKKPAVHGRPEAPAEERAPATAQKNEQTAQKNEHKATVKPPQKAPAPKNAPPEPPHSRPPQEPRKQKPPAKTPKPPAEEKPQ